MERIPDVSRQVARPAPGVTARTVHGRIVLERRRFGPVRRIFARLVRVPTTVTANLDEVGSAAWLLLDGRSVAAVKAELERRFPGQSDLAVRLGKFLGPMVSRGFVVLS
ncbi:MAG: PqqD family peptide modification chaperone [Candidatus Thermoplasmatota archaeon]